MTDPHWFTDTCDVKRLTRVRTSTGAEDLTEAAHLADQRCRLSIKTERVASPSLGMIRQTTYKLFLPALTDIRTGDLVDIDLPEGTAGTTEGAAASALNGFRVVEVLPRRDRHGKSRFVSATLEEVD